MPVYRAETACDASSLQVWLLTETSFQRLRASATGLKGFRYIALEASNNKKGEQRSPQKNGLSKLGLGSFTKLGLQIVKARFRFFHLCFQLGAISQRVDLQIC